MTRETDDSADRARRFLGRPGRIALVLAFAGSLVACSPGYVLRAAWEEARILLKRRPIDQVLSDPSLDLETRAKLELVVEARSYAARDLGLRARKSYTSFAEIGRDTLALVLSASPVDRLVPYTWWFPIVGRVPYKGFFDPDAAQEERRHLERRGYDTYLRPTSAFSTLGWLPDPLLSTVIRQDSVGLVETVIHELTHNTLFVPGHVKFNESLANFVGSTGAIEFFCRRRYDVGLCQRARDRWDDSRRFGRFLDEVWTELDSLYALELPREELMPRREALLRDAAARYRRDTAPLMRSAGFARFDATRLNNARLVARHLYYHRLDLFDRYYRSAGDLGQALPPLRAAVGEGDDPWEALQGLVDAADPEAPPHTAPSH